MEMREQSWKSTESTSRNSGHDLQIVRTWCRSFVCIHTHTHTDTHLKQTLSSRSLTNDHLSSFGAIFAGKSFQSPPRSATSLRLIAHENESIFLYRK